MTQAQLFKNGSLSFVAGNWLMTAPPHVALRLKRVFPQIETKAKGVLSIKDSPDVARDLEWFLERHPLPAADKDLERLRARSREHRERQSVLEQMLAGVVEPRRFEMALPPRDYQRVAADLCLRFGGLLLADEMGLGKTCSSIAMLTEPATRPALVVTLTHLPEQWRDEFRKFAPALRCHILRSTQPYNLAAPHLKPGQRGLPGTEQLPDVIITSYSKLASWADTLAGVVRSVVWDEVQELRHDDSAKATAARAIAAAVAYRLGLSGTPIYNYGDEIWNVLEAIRPGELGDRDEFRREHCTAADARGRASIKDPSAFGAHARESGLMLRRTRADVGRELPAVSRITHTIDSDAKVFEDNTSAAGELARIILAKGPAGRGDAFRASGEFDMIVRQATGLAKAPHVADFVRLLAESDEKVLLYGWHRSVYSVWLERLADLNPVMFTGSESPKQKRDAKKAFCEGDSKVLIMSLRAGAGIDGLQNHCRTVVFGELDWSPGVHEQDEARVARDGQKDPVQIYYLLAEDGSDPVVADILGVKKEQIRGLRDPNAALIERLEVDPNHVKKLAEAYLAKRTSQRSKGGTTVQVRRKSA